MPTSILIGLGELGSLFAKGLLKSGYTVVPVLRNDILQDIASIHPAPESVWICVAEKDLNSVLASMPSIWRNRCVLIQNELLPFNWEQHQLTNPTITSVWFEKKAGKHPQVVLPSIIYGPNSEQVKAVYNAIEIPCRSVENSDQLLFELVLKNLYIQTTNIAGLVVGGTTQTLVELHTPLMQSIANDVIALQQALTQQTFDPATLMQALIEACHGDPNHQCMGRSAPARLARALAVSDQYQLPSPALKSIAIQVD